MRLHFVLAALLADASASAQGVQLLDVVAGPGSSTLFGEFFEDVGDANGDGVSDFIVTLRAGNAIRLVSGRDRSVLFERTDVFPPSVSGWIRCSAAGDFDGDGSADVLVGFAASSPNQQGSSVQVLSGVDGAVLWEVSPPPGATPFPSSLAGTIDVDGDGVLDVLVGASSSRSLRGSVFAFSGATGAVLWRTDGNPGAGSASGELLGWSTTLLDDVDGDGIQDLAARGWNGPTITFGEPGHVRILSGATGATLAAREGAVVYARLGQALATIPDRDGDGLRDIAATRAAPSSAAGVVLLSGSDLSVLSEVLLPQSGSGLAESIDGGADFDGDGFPDLIVGGLGEVHVYSGADDTLRWSLPGGSQFFGRHVRFLGDVDDDGLPEAAASESTENPGKVFLYESTPANGGVVCVGRPNAVGERGRMVAESPSGYAASARDLVLRAMELPAGSFGVFLAGSGRDRVVDFRGSRGTLCLGGGGFGRLNRDPVPADGVGVASLAPDLEALPWSEAGAFGLRSVMAGETYAFQLWYRDSPGASNFSDAVEVTFR